MTDFPLLSLTIFLPLLGACFIFLIQGDQKTVARNARATALLVSGFTFLLSLYMYAGFDKSSDAYQFVESAKWLPNLKISYKVGLDGLSVLFVLLSTFLTPICILGSRSIEKRVKEYMMAFLLLETMMIGMFSSIDMVLFYIFFEGVLIPMFLIIGIWGGERRVYAAFKFFLYTLLGSVLLLVAMLALYRQTGTTDIESLSQIVIPYTMQKWVWMAFFASFAVKVPMWPFHTWLPDAHVEAPTAGSVILAGILLKMGGYGFLRLSLPILPEASYHFTYFIFALSVTAIIYTSLVALVQHDMKKMIAYSSVAHMGFVTLGIFAATPESITGAVFQMLSHGIVSGALFLCVGVVYDRLHTREISRYGGVVNPMPFYAAVLMVFTMASIALPGTGGFVGEFLVLIGTYKISNVVTAFAAIGVILGAAYMLYLYRRVVFGPLVHADVKKMTDLDRHEIIILLPLLFLVIWMGVYPSSFLTPLKPTLSKIFDHYQYRVNTGLKEAEMRQEQLKNSESLEKLETREETAAP